jgi:hypothetical protein
MSLVAGFQPRWPRFEPRSDNGICGGQRRQVISKNFANFYSAHYSTFVNHITIKVTYIVSILTTSLNNQLKRAKYPSFATVFRNTKQSGYDAVCRLSFFLFGSPTRSSVNSRTDTRLHHSQTKTTMVEGHIYRQCLFHY